MVVIRNLQLVRRLPAPSYSSESGVAVVWMLVSLGAMLAVAALALDILRQELVSHQAKIAAEAASLAAAKELNGTIDGWKKARLAALAVIKAHRISGVSAGDIQALSANASSGGSEFFGSPQAYADRVMTSGNITMTLERGTYAREPEEDNKFRNKFVSVEYPGRDVAESKLELLNSDQGLVPMRFKVPAHLIANAAVVKVQVSGLRTLFAQVIGITSLPTTGISSIAAHHFSDSTPVAPFAIPACQLLLDSNPTNYDKYQSSRYFPENQCGREVVISEVDPLSPPVDLDHARYRKDGIVRSETYPAPPPFRYNKTANLCYSDDKEGDLPNCKAVPIRGVIGAWTSNENEQGFAAPAEIASAFQSLKAGTARAALGDYFKPLKDLQDISYLQSDFTLPNLFGDSDWPSLSTALAGNMPVNRHGDSAWLDVNYGNVWTVRMSDNPGWQNPMCTSFDPGLSADTAKAIPIRIMVIAPSDGSSRYCDYRALFTEGEQDSLPPTPDTQPRVVGFVRAHMFDYRVTNYPTDTGIPGDNNPARLITLGSGLSDTAFEPYRQFREEHRNWEECNDCVPCTGEDPEPPHKKIPHGCSTSCGTCGSEPQPPSENYIFEYTQEDWNYMSQYYYLPNYQDLQDCLHNLNLLNALHCIGMYFENRGNNFGTRIGGESGPVCLPAKREYKEHCVAGADETCFCPPTDRTCWEAKERVAQYGCGGFRVRLDCNQDGMVYPLRANESRAVLVREAPEASEN